MKFSECSWRGLNEFYRCQSEYIQPTSMHNAYTHTHTSLHLRRWGIFKKYSESCSTQKKGPLFFQPFTSVWYQKISFDLLTWLYVRYDYLFIHFKFVPHVLFFPKMRNASFCKNWYSTEPKDESLANRRWLLSVHMSLFLNHTDTERYKCLFELIYAVYIILFIFVAQ